MGFLTPLYLAGLAALTLPLLAHLVRRTPRGRQVFSSLMFLAPSPPKLTRRSRLDEFVLLLLRAAALALLAVAFARPFLRESAVLPFDLAARRVAIVLDTSASMRRADVWRQALARADEALNDLGAKDDVALFTFDDHLQTVVDFADDGSPAANKAEIVRGRLKDLRPGWGGSDLGAALVAVAGELDVADDLARARAEPLLVLISDLQHGSRTDAFEAYEWPAAVPVALHTVAAERPTNAHARLLVDEAESDAAAPRVLVTNAADSSGEQFTVRWTGDKADSTPGEPAMLFVPPAQSRVARLLRPADAASADRIELTGDDTVFDNSYYVVPPAPQELRLVYLGDDPADAPRGPRYFLELALADDPLRKVAVHAPRDDVPLFSADDPWHEPPPALIVATRPIAKTRLEEIGRYVKSGGTLLAIVENLAAADALTELVPGIIPGGQSNGRMGGAAAGGTGMMGQMSPPPEPISERPRAGALRDGADYRLLGEIDYTHPLFAVFANPRYGDFTKIHFWKHQPLSIKPESATRMLARFDNGDPAILERALGAGRVLVFTSGWQPADSQLALSSKFVPLIQSVVDLASGRPPAGATLTVNQPLPIGDRQGEAILRKPDGTQIAVSQPTASEAPLTADQPGIYRLTQGGREMTFAVNLAAAESDTAPLDPERLERLGVRLASGLTSAERSKRLRQQRDIELEGHQKVWRWLIVAALAILIVETWLAGRKARQIHSSVEALA